MSQNHDFAPRFQLALHAIGLSRGRAASLLAVDKSLVGRWAAGSVRPSEHNLVRITELVAGSVPGFAMPDWQLDEAAFARRLGVDENALAAMGGGAAGEHGLPPRLVASAKAESARRRGAYEGFWRTSRPSVMMAGRILHDHGMIRASSDGVLEVRMGGAGLVFKGCAVVSEGNFFATLYDEVGCTPIFLVFRGVPLPRALTLDGLMLFCALDSSRTPAAVPILLERIGDLSGRREEDEARCEEYCRLESPAGEEPPAVLAHLLREVGPEAAREGGSLLLTVGGAFSRGTSPSGDIRG